MKFNEAESMFSRFNPLVLPLDVAIETSQLMLDTLKMADDWQTNLDNDYFYHLSENYTVNFWREWGVVDDSTPYFITIFGVDSDGTTDYDNRAWSNYVEPPDDDEDECNVFVYKPCPFCGAEPSLEMYDDKPYVSCTNAACPMLECEPIILHLWNARPVEEGLIDRLHEAVSDNKQQAKEQTSEKELTYHIQMPEALDILLESLMVIKRRIDKLQENKAQLICAGNELLDSLVSYAGDRYSREAVNWSQVITELELSESEEEQ